CCACSSALITIQCLDMPSTLAEAGTLGWWNQAGIGRTFTKLILSEHCAYVIRGWRLARGDGDKFFAIPSKSGYCAVEAACGCELQLSIPQRPSAGGRAIWRQFKPGKLAGRQKVIRHDLLLIEHVVPAEHQQSRPQMRSQKVFLHSIR